MKDIIECVVAAVTITALFILYIFATPDQKSGEADWQTQYERGE